MNNQKKIQLCLSGAWCASMLTADFSWPLFLVRMCIGLAALFYLRDRFAGYPRKLTLIRYSIAAVSVGVCVGFTFAILDLVKRLSADLA